MKLTFPQVLLVQIIVSLLLVHLDIHLWEQNVLSGLVGNPNNFAFLLNLALLAVLKRHLSEKNSCLVFIFTFSIFSALAFSQVLILLINIGIFSFYTAFINKNFKKSALIVIITSISFFISATHNPMLIHHPIWLNVYNKILTVSGLNSLEQVELQNTDISISVTNREREFEEIVSFLKKAPFNSILFGKIKKHYVRKDSQYSSLLLNHGIFVLISFITALFFFTNTNETLAILTIFLALIFTPLLYYFPSNIILLTFLRKKTTKKK